MAEKRKVPELTIILLNIFQQTAIVKRQYVEQQTTKTSMHWPPVSWLIFPSHSLSFTKKFRDDDGSLLKEGRRAGSYITKSGKRKLYLQQTRNKSHLGTGLGHVINTIE